MNENKIAIVVLTKGYDDIKSYDSLITRNKLIQKHLISESKYEFDIIIFHEGNITLDHQTYITEKSNLPLIFKNVKECGDKSAFDDNRNIVNTELCPPTELSKQFPLGYKHMCHFWSIGLFNYLSDYKYVIRMDEDVFLLRLNVNLLEQIIDKNIKYIVPYLLPTLDDPNVIVGLDVLLNKFCKENNIVLPIKYENIPSPNTNFAIFDLQYFKNHKIIQKFLSEVDKSHGIYSNRWGDAPIWGILLYILQNEPFYVYNIEYIHGSHGHHINKR